MRVLSLVVLVALTGCTTTAVLQESTPVRISARPPPPPPPPPEPPPRVEVEETRIRVDEKIHFEFDSAEISSVSDNLIEEIAQVMNAHPELTRIRIEGHTDNVGTAAYNDRLSQERAESVVAKLVEYGVERGRLDPQGFGFSRPIADNETDEGRAQNRRVEFNIVERDPSAAAAAPEAGTTPASAAGATPAATQDAGSTPDGGVQ